MPSLSATSECHDNLEPKQSVKQAPRCRAQVKTVALVNRMSGNRMSGALNEADKFGDKINNKIGNKISNKIGNKIGDKLSGLLNETELPAWEGGRGGCSRHGAWRSFARTRIDLQSQIRRVLR